MADKPGQLSTVQTMSMDMGVDMGADMGVGADGSDRDLAAQLLKEAAGAGPSVLSALQDLLGKRRVTGYHLFGGTGSRAALICTPTALHRAEFDQEGRQLLVSIPHRHITQVIERRDGSATEVTIEVAADVKEERMVGQTVSGAAVEDGMLVEGTQVSRSEARSSIHPTSYTVSAEGDAQSALQRFAQAARDLLEEQPRP